MQRSGEGWAKAAPKVRLWANKIGWTLSHSWSVQFFPFLFFLIFYFLFPWDFSLFINHGSGRTGHRWKQSCSGQWKAPSDSGPKRRLCVHRSPPETPRLPFLTSPHSFLARLRGFVHLPRVQKGNVRHLSLL